MSIIINSEHVCVLNPLQKFLYLAEKSNIRIYMYVCMYVCRFICIILICMTPWLEIKVFLIISVKGYIYNVNKYNHTCRPCAC
jgi:hypothetical protein